MVWTYDALRDTVRPSRVEETGAQTNFYSVQDQDGSYRDDIDEWLRGVEDKAASGYERLLAGEIPRGQERADFSTFVSSLYVRSPGMIRAFAETYGQFVQMQLGVHWRTRESFDAFMDRFEREKGPIEGSRDAVWEFWNDKDRYTVGVDLKRGLGAMGASDRIQTVLFERRWYVLDAGPDFFITCDGPVYRRAPRKAHELYGDGGFLNPDVEVTLPLSPSHMLLITGRKLAGTHFRVPAGTVWDLNKLRAISSERFLYSHVRDERVQALATEHKEDRLGFQIGWPGGFAEVEVLRRMRERSAANR